MKNVLILCVLLLGINHLQAQEEVQRPRGFHQHKGFYLSMNIGPLWGNVMDYEGASRTEPPYTLNFIGAGGMMDYKIGWAVRENLILHVTAISNIMPVPTVIATVGMNSSSTKFPSTFSFGEVMYGVGMTYYVMPSNVFLSGSIGMGKFMIDDSKNPDIKGTTKGGFSMQLKLGKEWWVSRNWGLGMGLTYAKTNVNNDIIGTPSEELHSSRFGILFNTTFN
jgi:hypothetical protein